MYARKFTIWSNKYIFNILGLIQSTDLAIKIIVALKILTWSTKPALMITKTRRIDYRECKVYLCLSCDVMAKYLQNIIWEQVGVKLVLRIDMIILSHCLASTGADGPVPSTLHIVHSPWSATIPPSAKQGEPTLPHSLRQIIFMVSLLALYLYHRYWQQIRYRCWKVQIQAREFCRSGDNFTVSKKEKMRIGIMNHEKCSMTFLKYFIITTPFLYSFCLAKGTA